MDNIGGFIWVIVVIVFTIFNKAQKNAKKQQQQQQNTTTNAGKTALQSRLDRAMNQINEIKSTASDQAKSPESLSYQRIQASRNQHPESKDSLEGKKVEGFKVEGVKVEGLAQTHNTMKFKKNTTAKTESSMKSGFAGEGCDEHYDMELVYSDISSRKLAKTKTLNFSDNQIVQGIIMSQVLERPKRR